MYICFTKVETFELRNNVKTNVFKGLHIFQIGYFALTCLLGKFDSAVTLFREKKIEFSIFKQVYCF